MKDTFKKFAMLSFIFLIGLFVKVVYVDDFSINGNGKTSNFSIAHADAPSCSSTSSSDAACGCGDSGTGDGDSACCGPCQ